MTGVLWAAVSGVAFGLFQSTNRVALRGMDPYASTFLQLLISAAILVVVSVATEDLGRLAATPAVAWLSFSAAGLVHFFVGWTLLNLSQKRLGAVRTGPLLATNPLFGVVIAAVALHELPGALPLAGVALIVLGVYAVELDRLRRAGRDGAGADERPGWAAMAFGLGAALCWAVSPILVRQGLRDLPSPLLGVTIGLVAATVAYGVALLPGRRRMPTSREALAWKLLAGVLISAATWARWDAVSLAPVVVVLGLGLLTVPTVLATAPLLVGRQQERITAAILAGSTLVVAGALVLVLAGA
jgi:drug/metabolite transporter (DMT)-like permease